MNIKIVGILAAVALLAACSKSTPPAEGGAPPMSTGATSPSIVPGSQ